MSADRYDICIAEKSRDGSKTYWTKVGVMFVQDRSGGRARFVIHMAYPAGELYAFEPQGRDQERPRSQRPEPARESYRNDEPPPRSAADEPMEEEYDDTPPF